MTRIRAGALALLLTAGAGLGLTGMAGSTTVSAATTPAPVSAPVSPAQSFVNHAYYDLMNHPADPGGAAYWVAKVNAGMSHTALASTLAQTSDYRTMVVERAYLDTMGRYPDPSGQAYWVGYLANGGNVDQLTGALVGSTEKTSQYGTNYDAYVQWAYQSLLGRSPDSAGEAYWDAQLAAGDPMWVVAASLSHSYEWYQNRVIDDFVYYHVGFPDAGGLSYWAHRLQSHTPEWTMVAGLIGTPTYATWAAAHA